MCEGDTVVVDVYNNMADTSVDQGTAIHWHGIHNYRKNHMDGTSMITQCPIGFLQTFRYEFEATPSGTHW